MTWQGGCQRGRKPLDIYVTILLENQIEGMKRDKAIKMQVVEFEGMEFKGE